MTVAMMKGVLGRSQKEERETGLRAALPCSLYEDISVGGQILRRDSLTLCRFANLVKNDTFEPGDGGSRL